MGQIRVVVCGARGRAGSEVAKALLREEDMLLAGGVSPSASEEFLPLPAAPAPIPLAHNLAALLERTQAEVMVDFTRPEAAMGNVRVAMAAGLAVVVGTTGLTPADLEEIQSLCQRHNLGAVVAPNFALGAVLLIHLAKIAAQYFDYADIIELHHEGKVDAPSGTAIATARGLEAARGGELRRAPTLKETLAQVRGGSLGGVGIHSVRLPGLVAHQEVIFGGLGQTLTLRHDTTSREAFVPGVLIAIRRVARQAGFVYGLDNLLGLS